MFVSIVIKALNEEGHIARAIESALASLPAGDVEVIVVDSGSSDRTIEVARRYPVLVVQLANTHERCCGIGPQLGYQLARGTYVCIIDGDMELHPHFLDQAVAFLDSRPEYAGVAGQVEEARIENLEFARRVRRAPADLNAGDVDRLNGGGLFRRSAIAEIGYLTDRNLHAYEEFELAARLRVRNWRLARLAVPFVLHHGHSINAYRLLWRRWTSGYVLGLGEAVRASLGRRHAKLVLRLPEVWLWTAVASGWVVSLITLLLVPSWRGAVLVALFQTLPIAAMSLRYRSLAMGCYAVVAWHVHALGFIAGLLRRRRDPLAVIESRNLHDARQRQAADHGAAII